jgi:hypothetical protein
MTPSADAVVVAAESEDLPAARSLPESHGAIGPGRGDPGSVGMKRKAEDPVCVAGQQDTPSIGVMFPR